MDIYVSKEGRQIGPFAPFRLQEMLDDGEIHAGTSVWHEGMTDWQPLGDVEVLRTMLRGTKDAVAQESDEAAHLLAEALARVDHMDIALQNRVRRLLMWRRFFARQIDMVLALVITTAVGLTWGLTDWWEMMSPRLLVVIISSFLWIPVEAVLLQTFGTTLGRWFFGLRVHDENGALLPFQRALQRSVMVWIGGCGLGLPLQLMLPIVQGILAWKQVKLTGTTLWDRSANSVVTAHRMRLIHGIGLGLALAAWMGFSQWIMLHKPVPARMGPYMQEMIEQAKSAMKRT